MKTILLSGQSNAIGRGEGGSFAIDPRVTVFNNENDRNDLLNLGTAFVTPIRSNRPFVNSRNNLGIHAASYLAKLLDEDVQLIIVAQGNTPISQWSSTGPMYARVKSVLAAAGVSSVDAFMWHQGEANSTDTAYSSKFATLLSNLEADGIISDTTPVVVGEIAVKYNPQLNEKLNAMATGRIKCANISTFGTIDEIHFTGGATVRVGWEYAKCLHDLLTTPWSYSMGQYVYARGKSAVSIPNSGNAKVPVSAEQGDATFISSGGAFVAPFAGVFRFDGAVYSGKTKTWSRLLDNSGSVIANLAYGSEATNPVVEGHAILSLAEGDIVWLGVSQAGGGTQSLSASNSSNYCKLTVTVMEQFS